MISVKEQIVRLDTKNTSYWFGITKFGHLEHIYYGPILKEQPVEALYVKRSATIGSSVVYNKSDENYCLDNMCLEWSGIGRGDFRHSPMELKMPDASFINDFIYQSHKIMKGYVPMETLPTAYGKEEDCETLEITLTEISNKVTLLLCYTVYEETNIITRRVVLKNEDEKEITLRRIMSMMVDIPNRNYKLVTFDGGWSKEAHRHDRAINYGMYVNSSTTGGSSNRHNPGFLLAEETASEDSGWVYGFNLIYSGNHFGCVELSNHQLARVELGINPHCFEWGLKQGEMFETPEAIMTFSKDGFSGMSHNFHDFINEHIVRGDWKGKERPVLLNNWEAHFFKFTQRKLLRLARGAKKLGVEMFVLDDGWFGKRNNDKAGLGDYSVNRKKLPSGMKKFADKIHKIDLKFGLWFEPEMVNEDSDLYRKHPEYAVRLPGKIPTLGRNQLVLDLCKPEVQDYIVKQVGSILDENPIDYVKWDMNRHMSEVYSESLRNQGEFYHRYMIGFYQVLERIFRPRPHILLESCSSGGNRFDLGMLCYSPQIWASDDTDPVERLKIQEGLSYLYPLSTIGAHVSMAPHQQTLRDTPLATRFNVACFGCLGYELDLKFLSKVERDEIKDQIAFYKKHRKTLQYGRHYRIPTGKENKVQWQCLDESKGESITGFYQTQTKASESHDYLRVLGLKKDKSYVITTKEQRLFVKRFGGLVKHILPIELDPNGFILRTVNKIFSLKDCVERYEGFGDLFETGILLNNQFMGSYYNTQTRLLGDFGSNLYVVEENKVEVDESKYLE